MANSAAEITYCNLVYQGYTTMLKCLWHIKNNCNEHVRVSVRLNEIFSQFKRFEWQTRFGWQKNPIRVALIIDAQWQAWEWYFVHPQLPVCVKPFKSFLITDNELCLAVHLSVSISHSQSHWRTQKLEKVAARRGMGEGMTSLVARTYNEGLVGQRTARPRRSPKVRVTPWSCKLFDNHVQNFQTHEYFILLHFTITFSCCFKEKCDRNAYN